MQLFKPKPFLCIGAQKAGTTWLYEALYKHPDIWLPPIKELQYFNEIYMPEGHYLERLLIFAKYASVYAETLKSEPYQPFGSPAPAEYDRFRWHCEYFSIRTDEDYRRYLIGGAGRAKACGEMTPEYSLLPVEGFRHIQRTLPGVRLLFLLRDPVDRLWSQLRMQATRSGQDAEEIASHIGTQIPILSNYEATIRNAREAGISKLKLVLYEDLFSEETMSDILSFLGLSRKIPDAMRPILSKVIHAGERREIPDVFVDRARAVLGPVYDFIDEIGIDVRGKWAHR